VRYFNIWNSANSTSDCNIAVTTAGDGHLAVAAALGVSPDLVLEHLDAGKLPVNTSISSESVRHFDVITMDAQMPVMSGYAATRMIRAAGFSGLIFGCTGNSLEEDINLFLASGANDVFVKPVDADAIVERIMELIPSTYC